MERFFTNGINLLGVHLGDGDDRCLVAVHAGIAVHREPIMLASEGENLEGPVVEE